jgi:hypothetical protein
MRMNDTTGRLAEWTAQDDEFDGSTAWRDGSREAFVSRIETLTPHAAVEGSGRVSPT